MPPAPPDDVPAHALADVTHPPGWGVFNQTPSHSIEKNQLVCFNHLKLQYLEI